MTRSERATILSNNLRKRTKVVAARIVMIMQWTAWAIQVCQKTRNFLDNHFQKMMSIFHNHPLRELSRPLLTIQQALRWPLQLQLQAAKSWQVLFRGNRSKMLLPILLHRPPALQLWRKLRPVWSREVLFCDLRLLSKSAVQSQIMAVERLVKRAVLVHRRRAEKVFPYNPVLSKKVLVEVKEFTKCFKVLVPVPVPCMTTKTRLQTICELWSQPLTRKIPLDKTTNITIDI